MRVLVNALSEDFGGVESLFLSLLRADIPEEMQIDFICSAPECARKEEFLATGTKLFYVCRAKLLLQYIKEYSKIFREGKYDVYHVNLTWYGFPFDILIAKCFGVKVVLHCHATKIYDYDSLKLKIIRNIQQTVFKPVFHIFSDLRLACSRNAGEYLFKGQNYQVLHNGIYLNRFSFNENARESIRSACGLQGKVVLGHIGRFSSEKNHLFLLRLLRFLVDQDDRCRLLCVGSGELFEQIQKESDAMGLSSYIVFTGQRSDTQDLLSAMDVFVLPSKHEALPLVLIEAQANGLPCVISDIVTQEIDVLRTIRRVSLDAPLEQWGTAVHESTLLRENISDYSAFQDFDIVSMKRKLYAYYSDLITGRKTVK